MVRWKSGERPGNNILERDSVILMRGCVFVASRIKLGQAEQGMFHAHVIKFEGGELCMGRAEGLGGEGERERDCSFNWSKDIQMQIPSKLGV